MASNAPLTGPSKWRSSQLFMTATVILAIFTDSFLFSFSVPILSYMFDVRLRTPRHMTQWFITATLTGHGLIAFVSAPVVGHFADKTSNRRIPMLLTLAGAFVGTALFASTWSLEAVFVGRALQAVTGSAAWIVGFACLSDNLDAGNVGKVLGTATAFTSTGTISGPLVSGPLLHLLGYWPAWTAPFIVLVVAFVARWLLIDNKAISKTDGVDSTAASSDTVTEPAEDTDRTALLQPGQKPDLLQPDSQPVFFYRLMLGNLRVVACLMNVVLGTIIITGFDATMPLHLADVFFWNTLRVGLIFLALQIPTLCFSRAIGQLRDRVGVRYPSALAWFLMGPTLAALGVPGNPDFDWIHSKVNGEALYVCILVVVGILFALVRGAGGVRLLTLAKEMESKNPAIFGAAGGNARIFSLTEMSFSIGCLLGPLISGSLVETIGYFYMNVALGSLCVLMALLILLTF